MLAIHRLVVHLFELPPSVWRAPLRGSAVVDIGYIAYKLLRTHLSSSADQTAQKVSKFQNLKLLMS